MSVNLSIKDVPDDVAQRLRARAERNHRSLQGELMAIVERAAYAADGDATATAQVRGLTRGTRTVEETASVQRARWPRPVASGPLAAELLRAERDRR